jgi:hypothetical protein
LRSTQPRLRSRPWPCAPFAGVPEGASRGHILGDQRGNASRVPHALSSRRLRAASERARGESHRDSLEWVRRRLRDALRGCTPGAPSQIFQSLQTLTGRVLSEIFAETVPGIAFVAIPGRVSPAMTGVPRCLAANSPLAERVVLPKSAPGESLGDSFRLYPWGCLALGFPRARWMVSYSAISSDRGHPPGIPWALHAVLRARCKRCLSETLAENAAPVSQVVPSVLHEFLSTRSERGGQDKGPEPDMIDLSKLMNEMVERYDRP